ncbi:MAG: hypothetical protein AAB367_01530 [Patescibacteria group bacterium]
MKSNIQRGFLFLELLVAVALISTVFVTLFFLQSKLLQIKQDGIMKVRATYYAEEAIEALRYARNANGWNAISSLSNNPTTYYVSLVSNVWVINTTAVSPDAPANLFARTIQLEAVNRQGDQQGAIDPAGSYADSGTRKVTVTVSWDSGAKQVVLDTYLTDWASSL